MQLRVKSLSVAPVDFGTKPPFSRLVEVDRRQSPHVAVKAAASESHVDMLMATTMPLRPNASMVDMMFFQLGVDQYGPDGLLDNLGKVMAEYDRLNLDPDPTAQAALNQADKEFAGEFPNMSVWHLPYGSQEDRAYLRFDTLVEHQESRNRVFLERDRGHLKVDQSLWFGGVPKPLRPLTMPLRG